MDDITSPADSNPQDTITRLKRLLGAAIEDRALALELLAAYERDRPLDRHWYVPDADDLYCRACNLPRQNRRHVLKSQPAMVG